jgi:catechol 2,3-dioxygenase-like lactoylglutathione lyase family enzyme
MVKSVDHIELIVRDVDEFVDFFQKLGFKLLMRTSHHGGSAELQLPGPNQPIFEIHTVSGEENIGINHIAFKVDNAHEAYEELRRKAIHPERGPQFVESTGRTNVNLRDPDGWRIQLVDSERKQAKEL